MKEGEVFTMAFLMICELCCDTSLDEIISSPYLPRLEHNIQYSATVQHNLTSAEL